MGGLLCFPITLLCAGWGWEEMPLGLEQQFTESLKCLQSQGPSWRFSVAVMIIRFSCLWLM